MHKALKTAVSRLSAVLVPAAVLSVLAAAPAHAIDWDHTMYTDDGDPGGRVRFEANGDVVELCDIEADGWKVTLGVTPYHGGTDNGYAMDVGGNGNCKTYRASQGGMRNLSEGAPYEFIIRLYRADSGSKYIDKAVWTA